MKANLLEMKQEGAGEKTYKLGISAADGEGAARIVREGLEIGLVVCLLRQGQQRMASAQARRIGTPAAGGALATSPAGLFCQGLAEVWRGGKALEKVSSAWEALKGASGDDDNNNLQNLVAAVYVQGLFAKGDFGAAAKVLDEARERGCGGEAFFETKMAVARACEGRGEEALVMYHTALGVGGGEEAKEGMERLERGLRGFVDDDEDEDEMERAY